MENSEVKNLSIEKIYGTHTVGKRYTASYKVYITENNQIISPFHSISPIVDKDECIVNIVNEIPRFENAKFEISKGLQYNPITQDVKKESLRFVKNLFPFKGYMWNYGAIPQTWEDKDVVCEYTKAKGDNDPIDVLDISAVRKDIGNVYQAKVLGCLALIDCGECDWKVIVIDVKDPLSNRISDLCDIDPKYIESTFKWLKNYKIPDGKPANEFGLEGRVLDKVFAMNIIEQSHESWKKLITKKHVEGIIYDDRGDNNVESDKFEYEIPEECSSFKFVDGE